MKGKMIQALTVPLMILMLAPMYFALTKRFPIDATLEISGTLATLIGTLWLAAGVYVSRVELDDIKNNKPKKALSKVHDLFFAASHQIGLGSVYLFVGGVFLTFRSLGIALHWF